MLIDYFLNKSCCNISAYMATLIAVTVTANCPTLLRLK